MYVVLTFCDNGTSITARIPHWLLARRKSEQLRRQEVSFQTPKVPRMRGSNAGHGDREMRSARIGMPLCTDLNRWVRRAPD